MTQKEIDIKMEKLLEESIIKVNGVIEDLKTSCVQGPVLPALERLEEAGFWLQRCHESQTVYNKQRYGKNVFV